MRQEMAVDKALFKKGVYKGYRIEVIGKNVW